MSRTRRTVWTYLTGLLATAVTVVVGLFSTPLLVRWLGDERFGACRVLGEYGGYLNLLELGVGGALSALLVRAVNGGDAAAVRHTIVLGVRVYALIALAMIIAGLAALPLLGFLRISADMLPDLRIGWGLALLGSALLPVSPYRTLINTEQRGYWNNLLLLTQLVLTTALAVLLAWWGWGITGQMLAPLLAQLPILAILVSHEVARHPGLFGAVFTDSTDRPTFRELRRLNVPTLAFNLCGRVSLFTDNIVLSVVVGPSLVTTLFATQRLAILVQGQLQAVSSATWAGLAELHVRGDHETFNRRLVELTGLVALLSTAALMPVVTYNRAFVGLWLGPERYGGDLTTTLAAANAVLLALLSLWGWCFSSTGKVGSLLVPSLVNAAVNLPASVAGAWWLGTAGPLLGTFVGFAGCHVWWVAWLLHREFGTPLRPLAHAILRPLLLAVSFTFGLRYLARIYSPTGWMSLAGAGASTVFVFLFLFWCLVLSPAERRQFVDRARAFRRGI